MCISSLVRVQQMKTTEPAVSRLRLPSEKKMKNEINQLGTLVEQRSEPTKVNDDNQANGGAEVGTDNVAAELSSIPCLVRDVLFTCRTQADWEGPHCNGFDSTQDNWRDERSGPKLLSAEEKLRLDKAEYDFALGLNAMLKLGRSLGLIRCRELFREKYSSYEEYCKKRWGIDSRIADTLWYLGDDDVIRSMGDIVLPCDHPRADDLSDTLRFCEEGGLEFEEIERREMELYKTRQGKYRPAHSLTKQVPTNMP
jgi:hypothetical protein